MPNTDKDNNNSTRSANAANKTQDDKNTSSSVASKSSSSNDKDSSSSNRSGSDQNGRGSKTRGDDGDKEHHVSAAELESYLKGIRFPVNKKQLIDHAKKNSAPSEVVTLLNRFDDKDYNTVIDVSKEISNALNS